jgi:hypothetical protein
MIMNLLAVFFLLSIPCFAQRKLEINFSKNGEIVKIKEYETIHGDIRVIAEWSSLLQILNLQLQDKQGKSYPIWALTESKKINLNKVLDLYVSMKSATAEEIFNRLETNE